jgi:hypothetical protein
MGYHLYCYKSQIGKPDLKEAKRVIEVKEGEEDIAADPKTKLEISASLLTHNPSLESIRFDYDEIAELEEITIEEAKSKFNHIELNDNAEEIATQITIFNNNVSIDVPFSRSPEAVEMAFGKINIYTKIIRRTAGYFVYDPQTGDVYDPLLTDFDSLLVYARMAGLRTIKSPEATKANVTAPIQNKKPWWKVW